MAKVQYGIPQGLTAQGLTHEQIAQLLLRAQMQGGADPSDVAGYDTVGVGGPAQHGPVYSVGQGLANAVGDIGTAYINRQREKQMLQAAAAQNNANNAKVASAYQLASNPNATTRSVDPMAQAQTAFPGSGNYDFAGQLAGNAGAPPVARPAFPTLSPQERANAAIAKLGNSGLASQFAEPLQELSKGAQPPPLIMDKFNPGETASFRDPTTGLPVANGPRIGGGRPLPQSPEAKLLYDQENGYFGTNGQGTKNVLANALDKDAPVVWHTMTPEEKKANNVPLATQAQMSNRGEIKAMPKEPGQVGPAYDANTGQPLGVVDYTDPQIAPKLATGEVLPHEPKVLQTADAEKLTKMGNMLQEYKQSLSTYKPDYSRIIGADSKLRGFLGGKSYNEGADWFNHVNATFIQGTKDIAGRSPQLIEEYNKNRPEATDAPNVVLDKLNNLIRLQEQETQRLAKTYKRGGYLGQQVDQAAGFDTAVPPQQPAAVPRSPSAGWSIQKVQ